MPKKNPLPLFFLSPTFHLVPFQMRLMVFSRRRGRRGRPFTIPPRKNAGFFVFFWGGGGGGFFFGWGGGGGGGWGGVPPNFFSVQEKILRSFFSLFSPPPSE